MNRARSFRCIRLSGCFGVELLFVNGLEVVIEVGGGGRRRLEGSGSQKLTANRKGANEHVNRVIWRRFATSVTVFTYLFTLRFGTIW